MSSEPETSKFFSLDLVFKALGAIFLVLFTTLANNYCQSQRDASNHTLSTETVQRAEALKNFRDSSLPLELLGQRFFTSLNSSDQVDLNENKTALLENLAEQIATAKALEPYARDQNTVQIYMKSLSVLRTEVEKEPEVEDQNFLWQAVRNTTHIRSVILEQNAG
jgi:hypothetical protein